MSTASTIVTADALTWLPTLPADSVDACVTDPPYGLSREPDAAEVLRHWLAGDRYEHGGGGFMGRTWDSFVPGPELWREVFRVLKPGGHLLAFGGTRTADLLSIAIRLAGLEKRDEIDSISWVYGNGFPKSLDISKALDKAAGVDTTADDRWCEADEGHCKRGPRKNTERTIGQVSHHATARNPEGVRHLYEPLDPAAAQWQGWGTALKPAHEPVLVFRKPCSEPTVAANVQAHGTGAINVDAGRIGTAKEVPASIAKRGGRTSFPSLPVHLPDDTGMNPNIGRWPANVLLTHHPDCRRVGTRQVERPYPEGVADMLGLEKMETVDAWECVDGCPVKTLGEQSGDLCSGHWPTSRESAKFKSIYGTFGGAKVMDPKQGSIGTAARFFAQFESTADDLFHYCAKASRAEREAGLDGRKDCPGGTYHSGDGGWSREEERGRKPRHNVEHQARNPHPTVKPLALMRYLVRLVTPPGGTVLDPFAGSGTTAVACAWEGFGCLACDREAEYVEIARARAAHALQEAHGPLFARPPQPQEVIAPQSK